MKILFLCHSLDLGGLEKYLYRFISWAKRNDNLAIYIICKSGTAGILVERFLKLGVHVFPINMNYKNSLGYIKFIKILIENKFNVICDFGGDFGAVPIFLGKFIGIHKRCVFYRNSHDIFKEKKPKNLIRQLFRVIVKRYSTDILSNSKNAFDYFYSGYNYERDKRFQVIKNGVPAPGIVSFIKIKDILNSIDYKDGDKIVLNVANARVEKNQKIIIDVAKRTNDLDMRRLKYIIIGGNVVESFKKVVEKKKLNNVTLFNSREDIDLFYNLADIFLFPSLTEGQPNALIEAIMAKIPFIASEINPIKELLPNYWGNRWLVDPNDTDNIIGLIQHHIHNNSKTDPLFEKLVEYIKKEHDEDRCFKKFLNVLRRS